MFQGETSKRSSKNSIFDERVADMNIYLKKFLQRGSIFAGFGPIIMGMIYAVLEYTVNDFSVNGPQICLGIVSTYILAFIQAGASVFNQIDEWSLPRCTLCHFSALYLAYVACYILNTWLPLKIEIILWFTLIFIAVYLVIWLSVFFSVKYVSKKMNEKLGEMKNKIGSKIM